MCYISMLAFNKKNSYFWLLLIVVSLLNPKLLFADKSVSEEANLKGQNKIKMHISGEHIDAVNTTFNDYVKNSGNYLKEILGDIRYYDFVLYDEDKSIIVEIQYNQYLLKKESGFMFKGGGAKYWLNKKTKKIQNKLLYK